MADAESQLQQLNSNMAAMKRVITSRWQKSAGGPLLPPSQTELLFHVMQQQPIALKELAAEMQLTPGSITQLVEPLERQGLVARQSSTTDRRIVNIVMTDAGIRKVEIIRKVRAEVSKSIAEALTADELDTMLTLQLKIIDHLKKADVSPLDTPDSKE